METPQNNANDIALWRYGLISELLIGSSQGIPLAQRLKTSAERLWNHPKLGAIKVSPDTLRHWIYKYRKDGIRALSNNSRKDKGKTQIHKNLILRLTKLREQHPHATTERLLNIMLEEKIWDGFNPSRSAFYRLAITAKLKRKRQGETEILEAHAFAYEYFGQMWVADYLHGPKVNVNRFIKKTYLLAIIDDATRYIVYAEFKLSEATEGLIDGLSMAVRRFGIPERFYTDNGSAFRSRHLSMVAARLSMHLPHTPAYRPQGRGKIERFFRTVRDQWLSGRDSKKQSLEELNNDFAVWLNSYQHRLHEGIGCSPLNKRYSVKNVTKAFPEVLAMDLFFGMEKKCKVRRNGTIMLLGKCFDIKGALPGEVVDIYYLPWNLSQIHVGPEKIPAKEINLLANAKRHEHNPIRGKEISK